MGSQLSIILVYILQWVRWGGIIMIAIIGMSILLSEAAKSKLSPSRIIAVAGSAILAAVLFWLLPTLVNYARVDSNNIVPDHPIGSYQ
ncbi:hypothetical protein [Nocardia macrotermitis]|uniref:Uncharacterized protein n=1 Tax=Nocardia macrotermitis TaxID=2585198 RepID=A0A7K0DCZ3_9NOCA|nr:hypothetical protein [Nocardia macrotermitis]MQY23650.1 hypothetical protein [Nocardia macrotermitis]